MDIRSKTGSCLLPNAVMRRTQSLLSYGCSFLVTHFFLTRASRARPVAAGSVSVNLDRSEAEQPLFFDTKRSNPACFGPMFNNFSSCVDQAFIDFAKRLHLAKSSLVDISIVV